MLTMTKNASIMVTKLYEQLALPPQMYPLFAAFQLIVYAKSLGWEEGDIDDLYESAMDDFLYNEPTVDMNSDDKVVDLTSFKNGTKQ